MKGLVVIIALVLLVQFSTQQVEELNTLSEELNTLEAYLHEARSLAVSNVEITIDQSNSNTGFLQFLASPGGLVNSMTATIVTREGISKAYAIPPCGWDSQRFIVFCLSIPDTVAQMDTPITLQLHLRDGSTASANSVYTPGTRINMAINPQDPFGYPSGTPTTPTNPGTPANPGTPTTPANPGTPTTPTNPPAGSVTPGKASAEVKKLISIIQKWSEPSGGPSAQVGGGDDQYWDVLQKWKIQLDDILTRMGIMDLKTRAALFTLFGIETERMYDESGYYEGDKGKSGKEANYSPANMNYDFIVNFVKYPGAGKNDVWKLNHAKYLELAVKVCIRGITKYGMAGFLNFHRGGQTGWKKPVKCEPCLKIKQFRQGTYNAVKKYMEDPTLFREGNKVWASIDYVADDSCCKKN